MPFFSSARWCGIPSLGPTQLGCGNDWDSDTYSNMPAAATHSRSTTSRGDPQQEHDHRRFRADQGRQRLTSRRAGSRSRRSTRSRRASRSLRAPFGRWRRGVMRVVASSLDVARALTGTVRSHRPKIELIGHFSRRRVKPRLRVEPTVVTRTRSVQIVGHT